MWAFVKCTRNQGVKTTAATELMMTSKSQRNKIGKENMTNKTALDVDNTEYEIVTLFAMVI